MVFRVYDDARVLCDERSARDAARSFSDEPIMGQIVVSTSGGEVVIEDEIVPLFVYTLEAIAELNHGHHVVIPRSNDYGYIRLDREGDRVRLSGDGLPDVHLAGPALLVGLVECAERFSHWAPAVIPSEDPAALAQELAEALAHARATS
jgi:hypothetical protein